MGVNDPDIDSGEGTRRSRLSDAFSVLETSTLEVLCEITSDRGLCARVSTGGIQQVEEPGAINDSGENDV